MTENEYAHLSLNEFIVYFKFLNERINIDVNDKTSISYPVLRYLEELKDLRAELEVYKKALEMVCTDRMTGLLFKDMYNDILQKAREE